MSQVAARSSPTLRFVDSRRVASDTVFKSPSFVPDKPGLEENDGGGAAFIVCDRVVFIVFMRKHVAWVFTLLNQASSRRSNASRSRVADLLVGIYVTRTLCLSGGGDIVLQALHTAQHSLIKRVSRKYFQDIFIPSRNFLKKFSEPIHPNLK